MAATFERVDGKLVRVDPLSSEAAPVMIVDPITRKIISASVNKPPGIKHTPMAKAKLQLGREVAKAAEKIGPGTADPEFKGYPALYVMAARKLQKLVEKEDVSAILWVVEKGMTKGHLPISIPAKLDNMDAVVEAGQRISEAVLSGELGVAHARNALLMLQDYAKLRLGVDIDELRLLLAEIETRASDRRKNPSVIEGQVLPKDQLPSWGGFQDDKAGAATDADEE